MSFDVSKMYVANRGDRRFLCVGDGEAVHGGIDLATGEILSDFIKLAAERVNALPDGSTVLLLGGGTFTLAKHTKPTIQMTVVEISPDVVQAAIEFFEWDPSAHPNVATLIDDAFNTDHFAPHDLIIVDFYYKETPFIQTPEYFTQLAKLSNHIYVNEYKFTVPAWPGTTIRTPLGPEWVFVELSK